jgi:Tfp pilus assembly protein PilW
MRRLMRRVRQRRDESGISLVEMAIALVILSVVVVSVDSSLTVVQERSVQVTNATEAINNLQVAEEAITTDLRASNAWTTPAVPTSAPSGPTSATLLLFTANLNGPTSVGIALNTSTHILQVCTNANTTTPVTVSSVCSGSGIQLQDQISNIDSASVFKLSTSEVSVTLGSVVTNTWFYTSISSLLTLDSPKVGAPRVSQTTLTSPTVVSYDGVFQCQVLLNENQATGSC